MRGLKFWHKRLILLYFLSLQVEGGGGGGVDGLRGGVEGKKGEEGEGFKGWHELTKPIDQEWPFSFIFFLILAGLWV